MRIAVLTTAICLSTVGISVASNVEAAIKRSTDIPVQSLGAALQALAKDRDIQVVYRSEMVNALRTSGAVGELTVDEALTQLLSGTGLTYRYLDDKTVTIVPAATAPASSSPSVGSERSLHKDWRGAQKIRLVRSESGASSGSSSNAAERTDSTQTVEEVVPTAKGIPEVLVRGSRSINADIQRTEDDVQPYVVFSRSEIENSMATDIEDFLRGRLTMNTTRGTSSQSPGPITGNMSEINLRGLGQNQTLILVNGRRMPGVSRITRTGDMGQPDINGIPLSAVERIEVLPSTASGIYGGGATGGVVNIILRRDYIGLETRLQYDNTFDTDSAARRIDANGGFSLEGGRTFITLAASYSDSNRLLVGDRDFAERGRALLLRNNPDELFNAGLTPYGFTTNIRSSNGSELVLTDGTRLGSSRTFVPVGYAGIPSDGGAGLVANAGQFNLDLPNDFNGARQSLVNNPTTESFSLSVRREFGSHLEAFIDASTFNNKGRVIYGPSIGAIFVPAGAPGNPFTTSIYLTVPTPDIAVESRTDSKTDNATGGIIARFSNDWMAQIEHSWSRSRSQSVNTAPVIKFNTHLAIREGALDAFRDVNAYPMDFASYLLPSPNHITGPSATILNDTTLRLSAPGFELPGGRFTVSALIEHRKELAEKAFTDSMSAVTEERFTSYYPSRFQEVDSAYLETNVPIISARNAIPLVRELDLQASIRYDRYETRSVSTGAVRVPSRDAPLPGVNYSTNNVQSSNYTVGFRFKPMSDLVLRASFGTGFLPPSLSQIMPNLEWPGSTLVVTDPKRENTPGARYPQERWLTGGNPDLQPENSESFSIGAIFAPTSVAGLRLSIDYTEIKKTGEISSLSTQDIVDLEDILPGRIVRGPNLPGDPVGWAGPIIEFNATLFNIAYTEVAAYDLQADYHWETASLGTFDFHVIASHQVGFKRQRLDSDPIVNSVGFNNGPLDWVGSGGVKWERGPWMLGWNAQYYDAYKVYSSTSSPTSIANAVRRQGSGSIPRQIYHDAYAKYRFANSPGYIGGLLSNTEILVGIKNVFDKSPPILASSDATYGFSGYGNPRLRRYSLSVHKAF